MGTNRIRAPNTLWYGDFEAVPIKKKVKTGLFSSKKVIVGYEYYLGFDMSLCLGPCTKLKRIWIDKEILWEGEVTTSGTAIVVNKPNLFGGKEKGGGFWGTLRFYAGGFSETVNPYLAGVLSDDPLGVPAYNGWTRVVFEKVCIGETNQLRTISFEVERMTDGAGLTHPAVGEDLNPMELLYQLLTLQWGGMDINPNNIDLDALEVAGEVLYNEGNGMSILVTKSIAGKDLLSEVLRQADATMYQDPETGLLTTRLIRNDYNVEDLPILDESVITTVRSFASTMWESTLNQLRVSYTNRANNYETGMEMAKDMANINAQGRLKTATMSFPGVMSADLANTIAHRELAQLTLPLLKVTLELNRMPSDLKPGDPFIFAWSEYQIEQAIMRVQKFNAGELLNGKLVIEAVQDEFAIGSTVIASSSPSAWTPIPTAETGPATNRLVRESHYFFYQAAGDQGGLTPNLSGILVAAVPPSGANSMELDVSTDGGTTYDVAEEELVFTPVGVLQTTVAAATGLSSGQLTSIVVSGVTTDDVPVYTSGERAAGSGLFVIGSEYFLYESVTDNMDGSLTLGNVWRALLDSIPQSHAVNDKVYFLSGDNYVDDAFAGDITVRVKMLPITVDETLALADATADVLALNNRVYRPAAPVNIKFDGGSAFVGPANGAGSHTVTWANRDRTSDTVRKINDNTNEYEDGQQTVLRYRKNAGAWTTVLLAPGVTTATFNAGATGSDTVDYELYSTRGGLDSVNKWTFSAVAGGSSGSSGGGSSPDSGGGSPADDQPTYDAPDLGAAVSLVFPFGETIGTYPINVPVTFDIDLADNFAGLNVDVRSLPADGTAVFTVKQNTTTLGTVSITVGGTITANTTGAGANLLAGDSLIVEPPGTEDSAMKGVTISFAGTKV